MQRDVICDGLGGGRAGCICTCPRYLMSSPTRVAALTIVCNDRVTQCSGCIGGCRRAQCSGSVEACRRYEPSALTMARRLSDFLFLIVDRRRELSGITHVRVQHGAGPIFIVISDVPKMVNVVADRCGVNCDQCVSPSCPMSNAV